jgi:O-antigen ligase
MNLPAAGFFLLLMGATFIQSEPFSICVLICLVIAICFSSLRIPRDVIRLVVPLFLIILIGLTGAAEKLSYNVLKDVWYVTKPIALLMLGYMLMLRIRDLESLIRVVLVVAAIVACWHLAAFVATPSLLQSAIPEIRKSAGAGYFIVTIAIAMAIGCWLQGLRPFQKGRVTLAVIMLLCSASLILSFSRTYWVSMVVLLLALFGVSTVRISRRVVIIFMIVSAFMAVAALALLGSEQQGIYASAVGRVAHSIDEITISDYLTDEDISRNWRGFESYKALLAYSRGSILEQVVGKGFGALVDLGIYMQLGDETFRYVPILHNGYLYLLVKTGFVGLLSYVWFLHHLQKRSRTLADQKTREGIFAGRLLSGLAWSVVFATLVIAGVFNKEALTAATLIIGAMYAVQEIRSQSCEIPS